MSPYLLIFLLFASSSEQKLQFISCGTTGSFTANSTYNHNLEGLLSSLTSAVSSGQFTRSLGQIPDRVDSLVLCRGGVEPSECASSLSSAPQDSDQYCHNSKGAIFWYDLCLLHYSDVPFLDWVDEKPILMNSSDQSAADPAAFMKLVHELLNATADWAVYNSSDRYAIGELNKSATYLYTIVQCLPNLSEKNCSRCLRALFEPLQDPLVGKRGGSVLGPVCTMRYEDYRFSTGAPMVTLTAEAHRSSATPQSDPAAAVNPPSRSQPSQGKGGDVIVSGQGNAGKWKNVVYITVPLVVAAVSFVFVIFVISLRKRRSTKVLYEESNIYDIDCAESLLFDLSALQDATGNFHEDNKLGEGGFGAVYKGVLPDGREIAVKRLAQNSWQGITELKNELVLVAKLQHRNLVRLLGVCLVKEKMIVYEFVTNGSLDTFLQDPARREQLHWGIRFRIICGIARGLQYLHDESHLTVVHRDVKASNILLDANMNPPGFSMASKLIEAQAESSEHCSGYMAPEYVMHGQFSVRSDVFSFGVLVLEIITGRKSNGFEDAHHSDLLSYVWKNWIDGTIVELLERSDLGEDWPRREVLRCIQIGLLCVEKNANDRLNMSTVVLALSSMTVSLRAPSRPAFWTGTRSLADLNAESFRGRLQRELIDPTATTTSSSSNELTSP